MVLFRLRRAQRVLTAVAVLALFYALFWGFYRMGFDIFSLEYPSSAYLPEGIRAILGLGLCLVSGLAAFILNLLQKDTDEYAAYVAKRLPPNDKN